MREDQSASLEEDKRKVAMMFSLNHLYVPVAYLGAIGAGAVFCGAGVGFGVSGRSYVFHL
jgi:hypothetical protein